ncbi:elongin-B-like [Rattus rattus]|uniref:elongin-B-like n=1 Tax=Rattus rattus TaxID=10117 RepID=UPI0013F35320|nr:elongin-B-like [Rattus rattus]
MDVFLMIRREKTTIFAEAQESSTVLELKRIIQGILKRPPEEQLLFKDDQLLDESKTLRDCGFTSRVAKPQDPVTVALVFREDASEGVQIHPYSTPLLPRVMKTGTDSLSDEIKSGLDSLSDEIKSGLDSVCSTEQVVL